jgi:prephenate dehydratase
MTNGRKIAYQGRPGANSHLACHNAYPDWEPLPCQTFEDAFAAVAAGEADLGMIPIENTVAGRVADVHLLLRGIGQAADIHRLIQGKGLASSLSPEGAAASPGEAGGNGTAMRIVAEWFEPVRHQLLAPKGATLSSLRTVESHVMALAQCRNKIRELGLLPVIAPDTALAAGRVALEDDKTRAAVASRLAAEIYGLAILAEDIEDVKHNTTRFIVLSREGEWAKSGGGPVITSFVFQVRNVPAALYKALGGFATNGVNMTKLESHVSGERFSIAEFYADIEGHPDDRPVRLALEELAFFSTELKILGVYPASPYRQGSAGPAESREARPLAELAGE